MTPRRAAARPRLAAPTPLLQALAHVGETDLREGLGPDRFAALARLTGEAMARPRPRRRWLAAAVAGLVAAAAAAALLAG